jgi:amino acid transporter
MSVAFFAIAFQGPTAAAFTIGIAVIAIAGPAMFWTIPVVAIFQIILAYVFAELCSQYPLTGGVYQWARALGGELVGFFAGLLYMSALLILMSALGFGVTVTVNGIFPSIALDTTNQAIITVALILLVGGANLLSVRLVSLINSIGVILELVVLAGFVVIFFISGNQPLDAVNHTAGATHGTSFITAFIVSAILIVGVLCGSETAGIFAEESKNSQVSPSKAIVIACISVVVAVGLLFLALIVGTPNLSAAVSQPGQWISASLNAAVGNVGAKIFLVAALIAIFSSTVATMSAVARLMFGMARDSQLPAAKWLSKTSKRTEQPVYAIVTCVVLSMIPVLAADKIPVLVAAFTGMLVLTYLLIVGALVVRLVQGWPAQEARFGLGRWRWPATLVSFAYVVFLTIEFAIPRGATNPHLGPLPVFWEAVAAVGIFGSAWWLFSGRHNPDASPIPDAPRVDNPAALGP